MEKKTSDMSWLETAQLVLRESPKRFMTVTEILNVIKDKKLRDLTNCHKPYATLYAVLHNQTKKPDAAFIKKLDRVSYFAVRRRSSTGVRKKPPRRKKSATPISAEVEEKQEKCSEELIVSVDLSRLVRQPKHMAVGGKRKPVSGKVNGLRKIVRETSSWRKRKNLNSSCVKPRRMSESSVKSHRSTPKLDLNSANSLLVHLDLKHLITKDNFLKLPEDQRLQLLNLLPDHDRQNGTDGISDMAFCNNYFRAALVEWQTRLAAGELTRDMRARMTLDRVKQADVKEPDWKTRFYEEVYGERSLPEVSQDAVLTATSDDSIGVTIVDTCKSETSAVSTEDEDAERPVTVKVL